MRRGAILDIAGDVVSGKAVLIRWMVFGFCSSFIIVFKPKSLFRLFNAFFVGVECVDSGCWTKNTLLQLLYHSRVRRYRDLPEYFALIRSHVGKR